MNVLFLLFKDPKLFLKKLINRFNHIRSILFADKNTKKFIKHNKLIWKDWSSKNKDSVILADFYGVSETNIARSYFLNILAKKHNAAIKSFVSRKYSFNPALHRVYKSFNVESHIITDLNKEQKDRVKKIYEKTVVGLKTKEDVFNLKVNEVWVGVDIYESYLMDCSKPTLFLDDPNLFNKIEEGISLLVFWQDYFLKNKVEAVVVSHDCYLCYNIVCKVAYKTKVPVYFPNPIYLTYADRPYVVHNYYKNYRQMFRARLSNEEQRKGILLAKQQLDKRLNGEVGVDMPYSIKSAFHLEQNGKSVLKKTENIKVLICSHCFYDNPHGYGGMLFLDFYEWLNYLGRISKRTNYDWYLKVHPDPRSGTLDIVKGILKDFPNITLIPHDTSHHQLIKEGIKFVLTVYGSVGSECPALGLKVINAAYNPRVGYDFNWNPRSLEEYEHYLLNLDKLHKDINMEDLYEFYYMHYYYRYDDDLVFESYNRLLQDLTVKERIGSRVYNYFLDQWNEAKHESIIVNMKTFIDSGKNHHLSKGPE